MNLLITIFIFLWIVRLGANLFSYIHLWFIKEYRLDRMVIHMKSNQGKRLLFLPFRQPPISPKTISLAVLGSASAVVVYVMLPFPWFVRLAIVDFLLFPIVTFFVLLLKIPTRIYHWYLIRKAVRKLERHAPMIVIGITGSYGKTSTKEILFSLLSSKYKTLKTEASKNSPIAIAELVLAKLTPDTQVFIVEMGAYKQGEIAAMCAMVKPRIGIVTAINEQHQDLFGTIENTQAAKYELVSGLRGQRTGIFNADDPRVREMAQWAKKDGIAVHYYSTEHRHRRVGGVTISASEIEGTKDGIVFNVTHKNVRKRIHINLFGTHQVSNVLAAMAAALSCGMRFEEIVRACACIQPITAVMNIASGPKGSYVVDDTFNNNPDAAKAAIDFLATRRGKKVLVFQPMIELGEYGEKRHREVGSHASRVCDEILLTNDSFFDALVAGARSVSEQTPVHVFDASHGARHLTTIVKQGDTVLFKGKESALMLRLFVSKNGVTE